VIIVIKNPCGTDETTTYRKFVASHAHKEIFGPPSRSRLDSAKAIAYEAAGLFLVVRRPWKGMETIEELVERQAAASHVLVENAFHARFGEVPKIDTWEAVARRLEARGIPMVWGVLDVSFRMCIEQRRASVPVAITPQLADRLEQLVEHSYTCTHRIMRRATQAGIDVRLLDPAKTYETTHDLLVRSGWRCEHGLLLPDEPEPPAYASSPKGLHV
jgi:hypothetical protein